MTVGQPWVLWSSLSLFALVISLRERPDKSELFWSGEANGREADKSCVRAFVGLVSIRLWATFSGVYEPAPLSATSRAKAQADTHTHTGIMASHMSWLVKQVNLAPVLANSIEYKSYLNVCGQWEYTSLFN